MEQYIKKSDVIKEINEFIQALEKSCTPNPFGNTVECLTAAEIEALNLVKESIDDIQIKEVDLDKEIKESIIDKWCDEWSDDVGNWIRCRRGTTSMTVENVKDIAKYFFELGFKAQKGE